MSILDEKLAKATKTLCLAQPFYGIFMMLMNKKWSNDTQTMCVGKESINYYLKINSDFFESLDDAHKVGLIQHEMLHIAFFHLENYERYKDKKLLNIAMDMEVNQYIEDKYLPAFNMSMAQFKATYDPVIEDLNEKLRNGTLTSKEYRAEMLKIPSRGVYLKDYIELNLKPKAGTDYYYHKLKEAANSKPGDSRYCQNLQDLLGDEDMLDRIDHDWEDFENLSESDKYLMKKQVDTLLKEVADHINKGRGTIPSEMSDYINGLFISELPKFNWKSYLRRFVGGSKKVYTKKLHRKYNKRFEDNPGLKIKQLRRIMIAVDTSGSVSQEEMVEFFQEIYHITKLGTDVVIVQSDAEVKEVSEFKVFHEGLRNGKIKIKGRGGTSFTPAIDYYNEHKSEFSCMLYLTDGEAPIPDNKAIGPMLWVISSAAGEHAADHLFPKIKLN